MQDSFLKTPIISHLDGLSPITVAGEDAESFLHGQLTADIRSLDPGQSSLAGWCDPKGRLLAIFRVLRRADDYLVILPTALLTSVLPRLRMFVLRARVKLEQPAQPLCVIGAAGPDAARLIRDAGITAVLNPGRAPMDCVYAVVTEADMLDGLATRMHRVPAAEWSAFEIAAGIPQIVPATSGEFVPQMVNLDLVGGVSFNKGCYPGQEIVARLHFRGGLKSRMLRASSTESGIAPGDPVFFPATLGDQVAGRVVTTCAVKSGGSELLAVVPLAARSGGDLFLRAPDSGSPDSGSKLTLLELPYAIPDTA